MLCHGILDLFLLLLHSLLIVAMKIQTLFVNAEVKHILRFLLRFVNELRLETLIEINFLGWQVSTELVGRGCRHERLHFFWGFLPFLLFG